MAANDLWANSGDSAFSLSEPAEVAPTHASKVAWPPPRQRRDGRRGAARWERSGSVLAGRARTAARGGACGGGGRQRVRRAPFRELVSFRRLKKDNGDENLKKKFGNSVTLQAERTPLRFPFPLTMGLEGHIGKAVPPSAEPGDSMRGTCHAATCAPPAARGERRTGAPTCPRTLRHRVLARHGTPMCVCRRRDFRGEGGAQGAAAVRAAPCALKRVVADAASRRAALHPLSPSTSSCAGVDAAAPMFSGSVDGTTGKYDLPVDTEDKVRQARRWLAGHPTFGRGPKPAEPKPRFGTPRDLAACLPACHPVGRGKS